jgi:copper chaperone
MLCFEVPDMTCGHCVKAITQAVRTADPAAAVQTDLTRHQVQVSGGAADAQALLAAIADAGYTPRALPAGAA